MAMTPKRKTSRHMPFPEKLHEMITSMEHAGLDHICWVLNGHAFMIRDQDALTQALPRFFDITQYRSFQRQLNMWDFQRIRKGSLKGAMMHPYFVRGNKELCSKMMRVTSPGRKKKSASSTMNPSRINSSTKQSLQNENHSKFINHNPNCQAMSMDALLGPILSANDRVIDISASSVQPPSHVTENPNDFEKLPIQPILTTSNNLNWGRPSWVPVSSFPGQDTFSGSVDEEGLKSCSSVPNTNSSTPFDSLAWMADDSALLNDNMAFSDSLFDL